MKDFSRDQILTLGLVCLRQHPGGRRPVAAGTLTSLTGLDTPSPWPECTFQGSNQHKHEDEDESRTCFNPPTSLPLQRARASSGKFIPYGIPDCRLKQPSNQNIKEKVDPDGKRKEKLNALKRSSWVRDDLRDGCIISEMDLRVIGRDVRAWECIAYIRWQWNQRVDGL